MSGPIVSVVVPAFDRPDFLADAVRGVAAQSLRDLELIVVDDGSPTDLRPAFEEAAAGDPRMRYLRQQNVGGAAARNRGVAAARGRWIAFLDHDDRWHEDKLSMQVAAAEYWATTHGGVPPGMVFCRFRKFGTDGGVVDETPFPDTARSGHLLPDLLERTLIRTLSVVLVHRDAVPPRDWFREDLAISNDVELYYRIARDHAVVYLPEVLVEKREHDANASSDHLRLHVEAARIAEELLRDPAIQRDPELGRLANRRALRHLLGAGRAARRRGDRSLARTLYRRAIRSRPSSGRAWTGLVASAFGL